MRESPAQRRYTNWPLLLGSLIMLLAVVVAFLGPSIAPRDPLEENQVIQVNGKWFRKPFAPFTPGFPLGSDDAGRDLLSRLLWGIRPTLLLVAIVAGVRLLIGIAIGVSAGWSVGRLGRLLDILIASALALPVLMVALGVIAAIGPEVGPIAFIAGLAITGWVETAQIVREQTRLVKQQYYIEAARALGESNLQIIIRHVRRQIAPLLWMLFAFEISSTLLITASLGFLGYYIGGDIYTQVGDYTARRLSGMPELGQMLATSWSILNKPWGMFAVGSTIFILILGFNLLGEGMQRQLEVAPLARRTLYSLTIGRVGKWIEDRILLPVTDRDRRLVLRATPLALVLVIAIGGFAWWQAQASAVPAAPLPELAVPGGHLWATERHDAWGTAWINVGGPSEPNIVWRYQDRDGIVGGPAVAANGTIYFNSKGNQLNAIDPKGQIVWQVDLESEPVGAPALDAAGNIYLADKEGGLSSASWAGVLRWRFKPATKAIATSGPIVAPDGSIYYALGGGSVQAVSAGGRPLWKNGARESAFPASTPPRLSPDGTLVFLQNGILSASNGERRIVKELTSDLKAFFTGADGRTYFRAGHVVSEWAWGADGVEIVQSAQWDSSSVRLLNPTDAGVTRNRLVWLSYSRAFAGSQMVWVDLTGKVLGANLYRNFNIEIFAVDRDATAYGCGGSLDTGDVECVAFTARSEAPIWTLRLEQGRRVEGGAVIDGRMYVTTADGYLYAIGDRQP